MEDLRIKNVNRRSEITVKINGIQKKAFAGESVLVILVAEGIKKVKTSNVDHEPRGALCGMGVCFECLATVNGEPNVRTCMIDAEDGMEIEIG